MDLLKLLKKVTSQYLSIFDTSKMITKVSNAFFISNKLITFANIEKCVICYKIC